LTQRRSISTPLHPRRGAPSLRVGQVLGPGRELASRVSESARWRSTNFGGFDLRDHQHVPIGVRESQLLAWSRCAVDDLPGIDSVGEQLLAQRSQVGRVQVEQDALAPRIDRVAVGAHHQLGSLAA
jgi:hypothetical protein